MTVRPARTGVHSPKLVFRRPARADYSAAHGRVCAGTSEEAVFFAHLEPSVRDNEQRVLAERPLLGNPYGA